MVETSKNRCAQTETEEAGTVRMAGRWRPLTSLLKGLVLMYRYLLSPLLPPRCRFLPTCSQYALEALERHGSIKGSWLALKRLAKCHPIKFLGSSSGWDPVPPAVGSASPDPLSVGEQIKDRRHSIHSKKFTG